MLALPLALLSLAAIPPLPLAEQERDHGRAEEIADEATRTAKLVCAGLQGRKLSSVREALTDTFSATGIGPVTLDGAGLGPALEAQLTGSVFVRKCSFKPFAFVTDRAHAHAVATFALAISGLDGEGRRYANRGDVDAELVRTPAGLRFSKLEFHPRRHTAAGAPEFSEVTEAVGMARTFSEPSDTNVLPLFANELMNGGLAVADVDGDGDLDVYVAVNGKNLLYLNDGNGHFTESAGAAGIADPGNSRGVLFVDLDNDGDLDLFVANLDDAKNHRGNRLYRNDGNGHFTDVTAAAGVGQHGYFTSVAAADVDGDGLLDLYVGQYAESRGGRLGNLIASHSGKPNLLLHNLGGLRFEELGKKTGVAGTEWTLAAAFADLDGDHKPELVVVNDFGAPRLYRNTSAGPGQVSFEEVTEAAGLVDPGNGMGIDIADYDGDGRLDISISKMFSKAGNRLLSQTPDVAEPWRNALASAARGDSLFHNEGGLRFTEVGKSAGIRRAGWAYGCEFGDVDNDGNLDLFVTNGYYTGVNEDDY